MLFRPMSRLCWPSRVRQPRPFHSTMAVAWIRDWIGRQLKPREGARHDRKLRPQPSALACNVLVLPGGGAGCRGNAGLQWNRDGAVARPVSRAGAAPEIVEIRRRGGLA